MSFLQSTKAISYYTLALFHSNVSDNQGVKVNYHIHGLWPEWNAPRYPAKCHPEKHFEMSKLKPIEERLKRHWYDWSGHNEHAPRV
jgi:hypothetical protein